jgi:hypothetical protein
LALWSFTWVKGLDAGLPPYIILASVRLPPAWQAHSKSRSRYNQRAHATNVARIIPVGKRMKAFYLFKISMNLLFLAHDGN